MKSMKALANGSKSEDEEHPKKNIEISMKSYIFFNGFPKGLAKNIRKSLKFQ